MREHSLFFFLFTISDHLSLFYPQPYPSWSHDSPMMVYT
nr:MAG TPA: hypothetical protein [Caudoviricetes sp.]